jgi:hypothetical protein
MSQAVSTIVSLVKADPIDIDALAKAFDAATHEERVEATRQFTPKIQSRLYEAANGRPVTLEDMVPTTEGLKEVVHWGTNTLPAFRQFQKRFCRPSEANARPGYAWGYNHNWYWWATAPGYYVSHQDAESGQFIVSYLELPPEKVESWPPIWNNNMALGFLVWRGMVDKLWKVSNHVTIGRAFKGKPMPAWFILVRED